MRTLVLAAALVVAVATLPAQQMVTETRDPAQPQDEEFAKASRSGRPQPVLHQSARRSPAEGRGDSDRRKTSSATTSARPPS